MLAFDRHRRILDLLAAQPSVRTAAVAEALGVAEETVRRDFEKLEAEGELVRTHGGAYREQPNRQDLSHTRRAVQNVEAKRAIARLAASEVEPGETIFLDSSSTAAELARLLPEGPLRVVTNGINIALELAARPEEARPEIVLLGGRFSPHSLCSLGALAEHGLESYHLQRAFISCRGVDAVRGLSEPNDEQAHLRQRVLALAERTSLLADHSKMGFKSACFFARFGELDALYTETAPPAAIIKALKTAGTALHFPK